MIRLSACVSIGLLTMWTFALAAEPVVTALPVTSLNPLGAIAKSDLKAFVEAPLFDPTRRLPSALSSVTMPVTIPAATVEPPPNVRLLGVAHGTTDVALVRGPDNKTSILSSGDRLGGWDVAVLPPNGLRLSKGGRVFDYAIFSAAGAAAGPLAVTSKQTTVDGRDSRP